MHILVTGGGGFVGSAIVTALIAEGSEVSVLDIMPGIARSLDANVRIVTTDLRDSEGVLQAMRDLRPDVICHQAAQTSVPFSLRYPSIDANVNLGGSLNLLQACVAYPVSRFVFASSGGAVYGELEPGSHATPDASPSPVTPYGCSKLAAEVYLTAFGRQLGLEYNILRYANVYGPGQRIRTEGGVVAAFVSQARANHPLRVHAMKNIGDAGCVRDYIYINDVVAANLLAIRGVLKFPIINVSSGRGTTTLDLAQKVRALTKSGSPIEPCSPRRADVRWSVLAPSSELANSTPLEVGLKNTIRWFETTTR